MNLLMFSDKKIMSPSDVTTVMNPPSDFRYQLSISLSASVDSEAATWPATGHKHKSFRMNVRMSTLASLAQVLKSLADVQNKQQQLHPATLNPHNTDIPSVTALSSIHTHTLQIPTYTNTQTPTCPAV